MDAYASTNTRRRRFIRAAVGTLVAVAGFGAVARPAHSATAPSALADPRVASTAAVVLDALDRGNPVQLNLGRLALAQSVSAATGTDAVELAQAWADSGEPRQRVVFTALAQIGTRYRSSGESPEAGFDCSGLTKYAWLSAGLSLSHNDVAQMNDSVKVAHEKANPGDLVQYPGHVMLYLGAGDAVVHAYQTGRPVSLGHIADKRVRFADPLGL